MAVTVVPDDLKELVGVPSTHADFSVAANAAILVVTEELASVGLSDDRLNLIALFLAAHYITVGEFSGGLKRQEIGESAESYQDHEYGQGLDATLFGQQAKALDSTGTLANVTTANLKARFDVIQPTVT